MLYHPTGPRTIADGVVMTGIHHQDKLLEETTGKLVQSPSGLWRHALEDIGPKVSLPLVMSGSCLSTADTQDSCQHTPHSPSACWSSNTSTWLFHRSSELQGEKQEVADGMPSKQSSLMMRESQVDSKLCLEYV